MKKALLYLALFCSVAPAVTHAQVGSGEVFGSGYLTADRQLDPAPPAVDPIASNFDSVFNSETTKRDFKRLREYREEKKGLLDRLRPQVEPLRATRDRTRTVLQQRQSISRELDALLAQAPANGERLYIASSLPVAYDEILGGVSTPDSADVQSIRRLKQHVDQEVAQAKQNLEQTEKALTTFTANISHLEEDLRRCETAIDSALAPEYKNIDFKIKMSIAFSLLIGVMIVSFFVVISRSTDATIGSLMLSDGGLQFVTIFVLIIAIILFGILSILEGRELAAILSGIAGYILGRGSQIKKESPQPPPPTEPAPAPAPAAERPPSPNGAPSAPPPPAEDSAGIPAQAIFPPGPSGDDPALAKL